MCMINLHTKFHVLNYNAENRTPAILLLYCQQKYYNNNRCVFSSDVLPYIISGSYSYSGASIAPASQARAFVMLLLQTEN